MCLKVVVAGLIGCAFIPPPAFAQEASAPASGAVKQGAAAPLAPVTVRSKKPRLNRDALTRGELAAKPAANLYDVVMSHRSNWMRGPATVRATVGLSSGGAVTAGAIPGTLVYVDGRVLGQLTALRTIPAEAAEKLCYHSLSKAQARFGLSVQAPVVEVFSRSSNVGDDVC